MPRMIANAYIERGLDRAVALGAIRAWMPASVETVVSRRRWLVIHNDGQRETMPAGAAWGFARGVSAMVRA